VNELEQVDMAQYDTVGGVSEAGEQYLTFILNGEEYGVDILAVQEIKGWEKSTDIPNTPDYVLGVINLRGAVIPVIDLRRRFGMDALTFDKLTVVIVVKTTGVDDKERTIGFVVDAVSDVYNIAKEDVKPPPDFGTHVETEFVKGLANVSDKMVILLDVEQLAGNG
jgi:purine-binding chemotaxis protein CheW